MFDRFSTLLYGVVDDVSHAGYISLIFQNAAGCLPTHPELEDRLKRVEAERKNLHLQVSYLRHSEEK